MGKIDELINKLCPNGVDYKTIQELCSISRGRVMSKNYIRDNLGEYPVYSSQTENNGELGKISTYDFEGKYLTWTTDGANAGSVFYRDGKFSITNVCGLLKVISNEITTKFLYYELLVEAPKYVNAGMGNPKLMSNVMARIKVAVPPLEIQYEIVRILDDFTELSAKLSAELSAELEARKKQYEYYRDKLLNFEKMPETLDTLHTHARGYFNRQEIKYYKLKDIVEFKNGKGHEKDIVSNGKYIVINSKFISTNGEVKKYSNKQISPLIKEDILMVMSDLPNGKALAKCFLVDENDKYTLNQRIGCFHILNNNLVMVRFLLYILNRNFQLLKYDNGVDQTNLRKDDILNIDIPVPNLKEQERIVNILDRFDKLCNDISEGLPAEIEAREKQYEYYRDKLLNFKELKVS